MKKLLALLLAVLLLLTACGQDPAEPSGTEDPNTQQPQPNTAEQPVQTYALEQGNYSALRTMGSRLLLIGDDGSLSVLQESTGQIASCVTTDNPVLHSKTQYVDTSAQGVAYYVPETRQIVLLNPQLQQISRTALPADMQGEPVICLQAQEVFYCLPGEILALDLESGISRLVRSHSYADQTLEGLYCDGQVLRCCFTNEAGDSEIYYISTQTGQTVHAGDSGLYTLYTSRDRYFAQRLDGVAYQCLTGSTKGEPVAFSAQEAQYASAMAVDAVIGYTAGSDTRLRLYDLQSGICTSQVTLTGTVDPLSFASTDEAVWVLTNGKGQQVLCRWNVSMTPSEETESCFAEWITAEDPDEAGLQQCAERAVQLSEAYGVQIHLWQDALAVTGGYDLIPEYQVTTLDQMLSDLEQALALFPEGFLTQTLKAGEIHVNLVRFVGENGAFCQFWHEGDCYITIGCREDAAAAFLYGTGFAVDSHVLGNSRKLDDWNKLNPTGFAYSYGDAPQSDLSIYLEGENPSFLEARAMDYPTNDRSSVFLYAMTDLGADAFTGSAMQAKLLCLCRGIREAYGLEKSPEVYPWEQYLAESLAYQKK